MQLLLVEVPDWVNTKDLKLENYSNNSSIGCFVEVNLDYSDELHNLHDDYRIVGEKMKVIEEMSSNYKSEEMLSNYKSEMVLFLLVITKNLSLIWAVKENTNSTNKTLNFT